MLTGFSSQKEEISTQNRLLFMGGMHRNLFKMFNLIGIGEHAGSGVPEIFDVWESEWLETPVVEEQFGAEVPDRTTLILPLTKMIEDISETEQDILPKSPEKSPKKVPKQRQRNWKPEKNWC